MCDARGRHARLWAEHLAEQFVQIHDQLVATAAACSDDRWRAICVAEGWTVGATVHHVAADYADLYAVIEAMAHGRPAPSTTRASLDQRNADHVRHFARCTRAETLALLRRNGASLAGAIRRLSDAQLARTGMVLERQVSVAWLVERALLGHIRVHLTSIQDAR